MSLERIGPVVWGGLAAALALTLAACSTGSSLRASGGSEEASPSDRKVYLASNLGAEELAELRALAPNVEVIAGLDRTSALEHAAVARGVDAHLLTGELLEAADQLTWVQAWSAGVERYVSIPGLVETDRIVFTNMKGVAAPVIAEHAFAMLLTLTRGVRRLTDAQRERRWDRGAGAGMTELSGRTMLVVGLGGIGSEIAKRAHGFDMRVLATNRGTGPAPDYVDQLEAADQLDALLPEADVVAICVPLTPETEGMFGADRIARMKAGAKLVNVARGKIVDTDALLAALESGHLSGACLDVTDPEPLPREHGLWAREDVVLSPHLAGRAELSLTRRWALFRENMRRFGADEPLANQVDKHAGY